MQVEIPSLALPVALVVEQTARILEDIKRKIQQQKDEEERLKLEQQNASESPTYFSISRSVRAPSDEGIYSASTTKSFIVLNNHHYSDTSAPTKTISPLNHTSIPRSLSPDSGTDYEPFSASSSISPPFLASITKGTSSDCMKLSHNSDDDIFKPLSAFSSFVPSMAPPKHTIISPTTSLTSIHSSVRRLSGINMQNNATTASLAKSTPSISTDLINECHQKPTPVTTSDHYYHHHQRPLSFQVLHTNFNFDTNSIDTYHEAFTSLDLGSRYRSLANLPLANPKVSTAPWTPPIISTSVASPSPFSLLNNSRFPFGDPSAIKPVVGALEYTALKLPSYSRSIDVKTQTSPHFLDCSSPRSFDESLAKTLEKYNKFVEKQKTQIELNQKQQQDDFLSLSLSPPMNRRNKDMIALKGNGPCL